MHRGSRRVVPLLAAMLVTAGGTSALANVQIVIGAATSASAGTVSAPISLKGASGASAVSGTQVDVLFPQPALSAPSCTAAPGVPLAGTKLIVGAADTPPGEGRLRLLFMDVNQLAAIGDGLLATCTFTAAPGSYGLSGMSPAASDRTGNDLGATICTGGCC